MTTPENDFHHQQPVKKCACGKDCDWCIAANKARIAFPRMIKPPVHDHDTEHQCEECFLKRPDLVVTECDFPEEL